MNIRIKIRLNLGKGTFANFRRSQAGNGKCWEEHEWGRSFDQSRVWGSLLVNGTGAMEQEDPVRLLLAAQASGSDRVRFEFLKAKEAPSASS